MNRFMAQLIFCFFAEDTDIFNLIMGQFGGVWAGRVIQGSGMSGAP